MKLKYDDFFIKILFFTILMNLICNYAFTNIGIKISKIIIPFNEIVVVIGMIRLFSKGYFFKVIKGIPTILIFFIFILFVITIPFDFLRNGVFALRDGTHQIDICYFLISQNELYIYLKKTKDKKEIRKKILRALNIVFNFLFFYSLFIFKKEILIKYSPKIIGLQKNFSLLGNFNNTSIWLLVFIIFNVLKIQEIKKITPKYKILFYHIQNLISLIIIGYSTSRITLGTYLFLIFFYLIVSEIKVSKVLFSYLIILSIPIIFILASGIEIELKRGVFNSSYIQNLILSIVGKGEIHAMSDGVHQRIEWISKILIEDYTLKNLFLGQGFGIALTNFYAGGALVREPHNSLITLYARQGILVAIAWILTLGYLVFKFFVRSKKERIVLIIGISTIIIGTMNSLFEPFFELPYNAIIFYIIIGISEFFRKFKYLEQTIDRI